MYDTGYTVPTVHFASATSYITYAARHGMSFLCCIVTSISVQSHRIIGRLIYMQINCTPRFMKNGLPNETFELAGGTHPWYLEEQWSERLIKSTEKSAAWVLLLSLPRPTCSSSRVYADLIIPRLNLLLLNVYISILACQPGFDIARVRLVPSEPLTPRRMCQGLVVSADRDDVCAYTLGRYKLTRAIFFIWPVVPHFSKPFRQP